MAGFQGSRFAAGLPFSATRPPKPVVTLADETQDVADTTEEAPSTIVTPDPQTKRGFSGKNLVEKAKRESTSHEDRTVIRKKLNTYRQIITPIYEYNEEYGGMFADDGTPTNMALKLLTAHEKAVELASIELGYGANEINGYLNGPVMQVLLSELKNGDDEGQFDEKKVALKVSGILEVLQCTPDKYFAPVDPLVSRRLSDVRHKLSLMDNIEESTRKLGVFAKRVVGDMTLEDTANEIYQHLSSLAHEDAKQLCDDVGVQAEAIERDISELSLLKSYVSTMAVPAIWITIQDELIPELKTIKATSNTDSYHKLLEKINKAEKSYLVHRVCQLITEKSPTYSINDKRNAKGVRDRKDAVRAGNNL